MFCGVDVLTNACPSVEFDHAVIEIIGNASFRKERLRRGGVPNDLKMPERVANPVNRRTVLEKRLDPLRRCKDRHGVEEHGRRARQRHIGRQMFS